MTTITHCPDCATPADLAYLPAGTGCQFCHSRQVIGYPGFLRGGEIVLHNGKLYPCVRFDSLQPGDWFTADLSEPLRQYAGVCAGEDDSIHEDEGGMYTCPIFLRGDNLVILRRGVLTQRQVNYLRRAWVTPVDPRHSIANELRIDAAKARGWR